jgi:hypothetical protein
MLTLDVRGEDWHFESVPNECPICHHAIEPRHLTGVVRSSQPMGGAVVELVFQCPQRNCLHVFIGRYTGEYDGNLGFALMNLRATTPYVSAAPSHPAAVATLSPQFVEVYDQATAAEGWDLDDVAGCGYRKALEFLIKDFCVAQDPDHAEAIKQKLLGAVVDDHILDIRIKASAKRATWLGNDETHYVRRWEDKDITDLKTLIALTESWVNTNLLTTAYLETMPEKPPK